VGYVFRLEKGCFCEEEGGHGRAMGHWGTVLECGFENAVNQGWHGRAREHGVAVPNCWTSKMKAVFGVFIFWLVGCIWV